MEETMIGNEDCGDKEKKDDWPDLDLKIEILRNVLMRESVPQIGSFWVGVAI